MSFAKHIPARPILFVALLLALAMGALRSLGPIGRASAQDVSVDSTRDSSPAPGSEAAAPGAPAEGQQKITVGFYIYALRDVDLRAGTFGAEFYIWMRHAIIDDATKTADLEKLEFTNGKLDNPLEEQDSKDWKGQRYVCWKAQGLFHFNADLRNYPFDYQHLTIDIEHPTKEEAQAIYVDDIDAYRLSKGDPNFWGLKEGIDVPEYTIKKVARTVSTSVYKTNFGDPEDMEPEHAKAVTKYSRFSVGVTVVRIFNPYFYKIILPLLVILGMAYLVFFIPPKEIQSATGLAITALLSCIAFDVTVSQGLPPVGYLIVSDKFFIATYFLLFLNLMQSIVTYNLYEMGKEATANKWDKICQYLFPMLYAAAFVLLVGQALLRGDIVTG
jgi:hypothetical protein